MLNRKAFSDPGTVYPGEVVSCCCAWGYSVEADGEWPEDACEFCARHGGQAFEMRYHFEFCRTHSQEMDDWAERLTTGAHLPSGTTLPLWEEE